MLTLIVAWRNGVTPLRKNDSGGYTPFPGRTHNAMIGKGRK
jgi:hypothetical protein